MLIMNLSSSLVILSNLSQLLIFAILCPFNIVSIFIFGIHSVGGNWNHDIIESKDNLLFLSQKWYKNIIFSFYKWLYEFIKLI